MLHVVHRMLPHALPLPGSTFQCTPVMQCRTHVDDQSHVHHQREWAAARSAAQRGTTQPPRCATHPATPGRNAPGRVPPGAARSRTQAPSTVTVTCEARTQGTASSRTPERADPGTPTRTETPRPSVKLKGRLEAAAQGGGRWGRFWPGRLGVLRTLGGSVEQFACPASRPCYPGIPCRRGGVL